MGSVVQNRSMLEFGGNFRNLKGFPGGSDAAAAKSLQSCPTLCDPIDSSPAGSAVPGILQTRTLEWVAYDGEFRLPLVLGQGSPIIHSSCEGELGVALESLQGKGDLIYP